MKTWMAAVIGIAVVVSNGVLAKAGTHHYPASSHHSSGSHHSGSAHHGPKLSHKVAGVPRDSKGRIERSSRAKSAFKSHHACPSTGKSSGSCPGYVIDHVTPLKRGGADDPSNMQWQTREAAKAKDKVE